MLRAIAVAALAVTIAVVVLSRAHLPGNFLEPALLALVGTLFLVSARTTSPDEEKPAAIRVLREAQGH